MKRIISCAMLILLLAGCGTVTTDAAPSPAPGTAAPVWEGEGASFVAEDIVLPEDAYFNTLTLSAGEVYYASYSDTASELYRGSVRIYTSAGMIEYLAPAKDGIWVVERLQDGFAAKRLSSGGTVQASAELGNISPADAFSAGGTLYLDCSGELQPVTAGGKVLPPQRLSQSYDFLVACGNELYTVNRSAEGSVVSPLGDGECFQTGEGLVFSGEDCLYLVSAETGIYALTDGEEQPVMLWNECGIYMETVLEAFASDGGTFLCSGSGAKLLRPSEGELWNKTELTIGVTGDAPGLSSAVNYFNDNSEDYYVTIVNYAEGGAGGNHAVTRLNTALGSGDGPDMLCFSSLSPQVYARRGYLVDMTELLGADPGLSEDDLMLWKAMNSYGGFYLAANGFIAETWVGLQSRFGDRSGWTLEEYLEMEAELDEDSNMFYNVTKERFLAQVGERYARSAIDVETATCDFDNEDFIEILEASARVRENPEPENPTHDMVFVPSALLLASGRQIGVFIMTDGIYDLAAKEHDVGQPLTCMGWPTPDASNGSDATLYIPVGICTGTDQLEGCWEFIESLIKMPNSYEVYQPIYKPYFERLVRASMSEPEDSDKYMTQSDADKLYAFLDSIETLTYYDEAVNEIILDEASAFFAGKRSAAECAGLIQDRVSTYVAEQYG